MQPRIRETPESAREQRPNATGASPIAPDQPRTWRIWLRNLSIAGAAGAFMAFVGALGTGQAPLLARLLYWVPLMMAGGVLGHAMALGVSRIPRASGNPWLFGAVLSLALALPATLVVWLYTRVVFGAQMPLSALPMFFFSVLIVCVAMTALMTLVNWPGRVTHAPPPGAPANSVRFLDRLPAKIRGGVIYAVSAEDHYLRVHTSKGSDLLLMRLGDAITELEGLEGAQTHRSWWVARDALEGARRDGDRVTLLLKGGAEAPVSRPNIKPLRDAGWF